MTTEAQLAAERFPDTTLPSVLPLPSPPLTPEDCVRYLRQLHVILNMNQTRLAEIMRIISYHRSTVSTDDDTGDGEPTGGTADMPAATGSGVQHVTVDKTSGQARFFVDTFDDAGNPYWYEIGSGPSFTRTSGFENQTDSALSWNDGSRRLTITPGEGGYDFWVTGLKFHKDAALTVDITDVEGLHFIYFDNTGTLSHQIAAGSDLHQLIFETALVAIVYWNATNNSMVFVCDERHGLMDPDVHYWIHSYGGGTRHGDGLSLGDIQADESGDDNKHAEFTVEEGSIVDEDVVHTISTKSTPAKIPVLYKSGSTPVWRRESPANVPIKFDTGVPQYNSKGGGTWNQTPVTNGKYFLMHLFAVNDYDQSNNVVAIQGEAEYNNQVEAREGALAEINSITTSGLPMPEFLALGTIIYQYNTAYANDYDCRIRSTDAGEDYVNWLTTELTPGSTPASHPTLTDRDEPNQHPADAVSTVTTSFDGYLSATDTDVQLALDTLDDHTHVEADITDLDHYDATAIHDDGKDEISAITEKVAPVSADMLLIEDSEDGNIKKMVQVGNLPGGSGGLSQAQVLARGLGA